MNDEQYHELTGRIQGLTDLVLTLVLALDNVEVLRASDFGADLKKLAIMRDLSPELESGRDLLIHAAELLDDYSKHMAKSETAQ